MLTRSVETATAYTEAEQRSGTDRREFPRGGRRADDPEPQETPSCIAAAWEDVRCRHCRRLLAKNTRHALRAAQMVELKCSSCNTLNYLVGVEDPTS